MEEELGFGGRPHREGGTAMIFTLAFVLTVLLTLIGFAQLLYLESMRLLTKERSSLEFFKSTLEPKLGYETEEGALVFSLLKHSLLVITGVGVTALLLVKPPDWLGLMEAGAAALLVMGLGSYVFPQLLYRRTDGEWFLPFVPFMRFLALLLRPLVMLLNFLHSLLELSAPAAEQEKEATPEEEIEALISAGEEEGIIEKEDRRLIRSVVAFGDKRVREVMTPRPAIVAIEASKSLEDLRRLAKHEQYSRIPIYEGEIDRIIGFVHVRDLYELDDQQRLQKLLKDLLRPIDGVPETMPVAALLREMQRSGTHIVYVVDEYGNVAGLATMEDLVEEILGEIRDEHEPAHDIVSEPGGAIIVSGSFDLDHLAEHFGFHPDEGTEAATVGGLVTEWLGSVPAAGATVERDGLRMEVLEADGQRVLKLRISRAQPAEAETDEEIE